MDAIRQKLESAIRKLDIIPEAENLVSTSVSQLRMISWLAAVNDRPPALECGSTQAQKELLQFTRLGKKLASHINTMHRTSRDRLRLDGQVAPELLQADIRQMIALADNAISQLQHIPNVRKGKPSQKQISELTNQTASIYETLTGNRATRKIDSMTNKPYGPLHDFTEEVYAAFGLTGASADNQLRRKRPLNSAKKDQ